MLCLFLRADFHNYCVMLCHAVCWTTAGPLLHRLSGVNWAAHPISSCLIPSSHPTGLQHTYTASLLQSYHTTSGNRATSSSSRVPLGSLHCLGRPLELLLLLGVLLATASSG
jgi:hypothetical protein